MIHYTSESQLSLDLFETPFSASLSPDNRWVKLSNVVPWDKFAPIYMRKMRTDFGRPGISPRMVLGAMIIKHMEKLDDRGVIEEVQENIYMKEARKSVVKTVNKTMVYTYFEIGRIIVEEEQKGKARAEYGKQIIKELSQRLTREFGKGFSTTNLKQMRQFYLTFSKSQTLSDQFEKFDFQLS